MIIVRSPLRIALGGGGTDLPSYYNQFGGFVISAAIDQYVYITVHKTFFDEIILKYSDLERLKEKSEIKHPIIKAVFENVDVNSHNVEITSMADIPSGTGLGSSGSFTTALLKALHLFSGHSISTTDLAEEACRIEIDILKEPIGKQDQYIAAHGGITCFEFEKDKPVGVSPLSLSDDTIYTLEDNLLLFFTGFSRSASKLLSDQDAKSKKNDGEMLRNLHTVKELGIESKRVLESGDLREFANLMNIHWENKKKRSKGMSNSTIDSYYDLAVANGALGGKVIGAGGGGFLLLYTEEKSKLRSAMRGAGLQEVRFRFDFAGTQAVTQ